MKILAFAATNSRQSINKALLNYALTKLDDRVEIIDLNDYELPIYSQERETELGHPELAKALFKKIGDADGLVISFAEHNGSYTAAYKNIFDWMSRIDMKVFQNKPAIYLAASPGPGGAMSVLTAAKASAPFFGADLKAAVSFPIFYDNYDDEKGEVTNSDLAIEISTAMAKLSLPANA